MIWATDSRPVLVGHVADHAVAPLHREVDVDVRHRDALGVQEALEQQVVRERVDVGDLQRVGDDRAGRRAAPGPHRDAVVLGELDEVPDDQEVGVEAHPVDHLELRSRAARSPRPAAGRRSGARRPSSASSRRYSPSGSPVRRRVARDQHLAELDARPAQRSAISSVVGTASGQAANDGRHLVGVLQIELVGVEAQLRLGQRGLGLHAEQRGVVVVVLAAQVVDVGRAHQRPPDLAGHAHDALVGLVLVGDAVLLHLEVDVVGPKTCIRSSTWARASAGLSSTSRRQKRDCRQPVSAMTSFE